MSRRGSKSSDVKIRDEMMSFVLKHNLELSHVGFEKADFSEWNASQLW